MTNTNEIASEPGLTTFILRFKAGILYTTAYSLDHALRSANEQGYNRSEYEECVGSYPLKDDLYLADEVEAHMRANHPSR
jgi:hypothetical protein